MRTNRSFWALGFPANELHDWSRICTVVDVYEALTSTRPYRGPLRPREVLHILNRDSGKTFDEEFLECWKNTVSLNS